MMFVKLVSSNMINREFQLKEGLNVDTVPFALEGNCVAGGLYYSKAHDIGHWLSLGYTRLCTVTVPEDAQTVELPYKYRSDKIILSQPCLIEEHPMWRDSEICKLVVQQNGLALQHVQQQTDEICKFAVQQNGYSLLYVQDQTEEICKLAVQESGHVLEHVLNKNKTDAIIKLAVQRHGTALQYVQDKNKTDEIIKLAVQRHGIALRYVQAQNQTDEIIKLAVQQDGLALRYVKDPTTSIFSAWSRPLNWLKTVLPSNT